MYVKKYNETSPIASSASHEITIIKADTIRTIIIDCAQKAMAAVLMQIAYAINQVLNHRAAADVIMRLLEKITQRAVLKTPSRENVNNDAADAVDNFVEQHAINREIITAITHIDVREFGGKKRNSKDKVSEDVKGDNKKLNVVEAEFIVGAERTSDDDNSPHTIKSAIDLAESESPRNREQNTLPPNVA